MGNGSEFRGIYGIVGQGLGFISFRIKDLMDNRSRFRVSSFRVFGIFRDTGQGSGFVLFRVKDLMG